MFSFIAVFFIFAPILIFYASGYRLDLNRIKILKTGTLYVEAKNIKDAQLFINNLEYKERFNEKQFIYNLFPGEYNIKLTKLAKGLPMGADLEYADEITLTNALKYRHLIDNRQQTAKN